MRAAADDRRARVAGLIGDRPLSARSVLATALLGADQPHLTAGELVAMASLFGISDGAARTCLWLSNGELTSNGGRKAATALHLAELREGIWIRQDNLNRDRLPTLRAVLDRQCVHFRDAATDNAAETVRSLFSLDDWAADARRADARRAR